MKLYALLVNSEPLPHCFTGLRTLCDHYKIPYSSAAHGKRVFNIDGKTYKICELSLLKIKGRGRKSSF